ncbi:MAG: hypothetical protein ABI452_01170 [Candidatus Limnocylindrales bacterium]
MRVAVLALALLGCGSPAPTPTLSHFAADGISFDYPSTWNAAKYMLPASFTSWIVFLSTEALQDPCDRTSETTECNRVAWAEPLQADGVYLTWTSRGWMSWVFKPTVGESIRVGNVQSTLEVISGEDWCLTMAGKTQVRVITPSEAANNWTQMDACINGEFDGTVETQFRAMLASVEWD